MIRKANEKKALVPRVGYRRLTGQLMIMLALSSLGCARGDWTTETLTLVDVPGTWEGSFRYLGMSGGSFREGLNNSCQSRSAGGCGS